MTRNPITSHTPTGDDLDGTLRAYFQAQMPSPWPRAPYPAVSLRPFRRARRSRFALWHSRAALAAAVALLIVGSWWLAGHSDPLASSENPPSLEYPHARTNTFFHRHPGKRGHAAKPQPSVPEQDMDPVKLLDPMDLPAMK